MTIAIVDDAVLIRQGLKKLIETSYPDVTIVG
ncbi:MAG: DNA-binding response regulator, partial [Spirochaetales bacterium]|nr:DNA-binding response regulator [Spirochaetales bacterium]